MSHFQDRYKKLVDTLEEDSEISLSTHLKYSGLILELRGAVSIADKAVEYIEHDRYVSDAKTDNSIARKKPKEEHVSNRNESLRELRQLIKDGELKW